MPRRKRATPNKRLIRKWQQEIDEWDALLEEGYYMSIYEREYYNGLKKNIALEQRRGARNLSDLGIKGLTW